MDISEIQINCLASHFGPSMANDIEIIEDVYDSLNGDLLSVYSSLCALTLKANEYDAFKRTVLVETFNLATPEETRAANLDTLKLRFPHLSEASLTMVLASAAGNAGLAASSLSMVLAPAFLSDQDNAAPDDNPKRIAELARLTSNDVTQQYFEQAADIAAQQVQTVKSKPSSDVCSVNTNSGNSNSSSLSGNGGVTCAQSKSPAEWHQRDTTFDQIEEGVSTNESSGLSAQLTPAQVTSAPSAQHDKNSSSLSLRPAPLTSSLSGSLRQQALTRGKSAMGGARSTDTKSQISGGDMSRFAWTAEQYDAVRIVWGDELMHSGSLSTGLHEVVETSDEAADDADLEEDPAFVAYKQHLKQNMLKYEAVRKKSETKASTSTTVVRPATATATASKSDVNQSLSKGSSSLSSAVAAKTETVENKTSTSASVKGQKQTSKNDKKVETLTSALKGLSIADNANAAGAVAADVVATAKTANGQEEENDGATTTAQRAADVLRNTVRFNDGPRRLPCSTCPGDSKVHTLALQCIPGAPMLEYTLADDTANNDDVVVPFFREPHHQVFGAGMSHIAADGFLGQAYALLPQLPLQVGFVEPAEPELTEVLNALATRYPGLDFASRRDLFAAAGFSTVNTDFIVRHIFSGDDLSFIFGNDANVAKAVTYNPDDEVAPAPVIHDFEWAREQYVAKHAALLEREPEWEAELTWYKQGYSRSRWEDELRRRYVIWLTAYLDPDAVTLERLKAYARLSPKQQWEYQSNPVKRTGAHQRCDNNKGATKGNVKAPHINPRSAQAQTKSGPGANRNTRVNVQLTAEDMNIQPLVGPSALQIA